jgi:hypothetical protein
MEQQSSEMHEWYKKRMVVCIEKSNKTRHLGNHHGMLNPNGRQRNRHTLKKVKQRRQSLRQNSKSAVAVQSISKMIVMLTVLRRRGFLGLP